ncbi:hypothetical protein WJX73_004634 [Symbiochloris irregularis]|uniref:Uncharacterized protein n=1 Tax=Symbiochloris irregularis TaxID=706552 RepID=A0AAW1PXP2_9CHLO
MLSGVSLRASPAGGRGALSLSRSVVNVRHPARRCIRQKCCAAQRPDNGPVNSSLQAVDAFFQRYDVLSTGMGALLVTSYCVWRGQSPAMALGITITATISGLVLNELFRDDL